MARTPPGMRVCTSGMRLALCSLQLSSTIFVKARPRRRFHIYTAYVLHTLHSRLPSALSNFSPNSLILKLSSSNLFFGFFVPHTMCRTGRRFLCVCRVQDDLRPLCQLTCVGHLKLPPRPCSIADCCIPFTRKLGVMFGPPPVQLGRV